MLYWQQYAQDKKPRIELFELKMTKLHSGQEML